MSKQRKRFYFVAAAVLLVLLGAMVYTGFFQDNAKTPGGVFVCL